MKINVLYVEDNPSDVELLRSIVETTNTSISMNSAETLHQISDHLKNGVDVIVSDFNLRGFDGQQVLDLVREQRPEIPFIFFTSTIGEEKAVNLMRNGATDFVLKDNINKLPIVIERAHHEVNLEIQNQRFESELSKKTDLLDTLFNSLTDLVVLADNQGNITQANTSFCRFFNTTQANVLGKSETDFLPAQESDNANAHVLRTQASYNFEIDYLDGAGHRKILEVVKSPMTMSGHTEGVVSVYRDVTLKRVFEEEKSKDQFILQQAEHQTLSGSFEFDMENDILSVSSNFMRLLNLRSDKNHISFKKLSSLIHAEDRSLFIEKFIRAVNEEIEFEMDHRYLKNESTGTVRFCKTVLKPYAVGNKTMFYGTIQDTTEARETSIAMINIQEKEWERISKELHDNVGQKLSASSMFLDAREKDIGRIKSLVDQAITDIRTLSRSLTSSAIEENSLSEAVELLLENTPNADMIELISDFDDTRIPDFVGGQIYRVIQEGLNNALKYSEATWITLKLHDQRHSIGLEITDNGNGFDPKQIKPGNGIRNMSERVRNCNGDFQILTAPNEGTKVIIKIPLQKLEKQHV